MKQKNTLILLADDALLNPDKWVSYIRSFRKEYNILLITGAFIYTYRHVFNLRRIIHGIRLLLLTGKNVMVFHPFGIIPFERNQLVHQLNIFLLICRLYSMRLFHPGITLKGSVKNRPLVYWESGKKIRPHWLYLPGIFAEKANIVHISSDITYPDPQESEVATDDALKNADAVIIDGTKIKKGIEKITDAPVIIMRPGDNTTLALHRILQQLA